MTKDELSALIDSEIQAAQGYVGSEISQERSGAYERYLGLPYGDEVNGRSKVVSRDIWDTVEAIMPALMRIFYGSDEVARFLPDSEEAEAGAEQATALVNHIVRRENEGYTIHYDWFKTALIQKNSVVKVYFDETDNVQEEEHEGLNAIEFGKLMDDPEVEFDESDVETFWAQEPVIDDFGNVLQPGIEAYNVTVKRNTRKERIGLDALPPEEFLISRADRDLENPRYCAHQRDVTRSDLLQMGFTPKQLDQIAFGNTSVYDRQEEYVRYEDEANTKVDTVTDPSQQKCKFTESYILCDYDGDGVSELRCVKSAPGNSGEVILENEPTDVRPFASVVPIMLPHKFYGKSIADAIADIQRIKTSIWRQMMDGLYLSNNPRWAVVEGQADYDALLTSGPGDVITEKVPGAIRELPLQWVGAQSMPMMDRLDKIRQDRTGVNMDVSRGTNADILQNQSATAANLLNAAAQTQIEFIARTFAETGVKRMFKLIIHFANKYLSEQRVVKIHGNYTPVDPRKVHTLYDVEINVGLGSGSRDQQLVHLQGVAQKQEQILQTLGPGNPLVSLGQYANTLTDMIRNASLGTPERYVSNIPLDWQPPPGPDPAQQAMQAQLMVKKMETDADMAQQAQKSAQEAELQREESAQKAQLQREEYAMKAELQREQAILDAETERHKADLQYRAAVEKAQLDVQKLQLQYQLKQQELESEAELEGIKMGAKAPDGQGNIPEVTL